MGLFEKKEYFTNKKKIGIDQNNDVPMGFRTGTENLNEDPNTLNASQKSSLSTLIDQFKRPTTREGVDVTNISLEKFREMVEEIEECKDRLENDHELIKGKIEFLETMETNVSDAIDEIESAISSLKSCLEYLETAVEE